MKVFLGSDHAGFALKNNIFKVLTGETELVDCGCFSASEPVDYADVAFDVCGRVMTHQKEKARGILFCGTGVGMAIAANKVDGIRAVCSIDCFSVKMARLHNDVNVLCLGGRVIGAELAKTLVKVFLSTDFEGGRHKARVEKLRLKRGADFLT